MIDLYDVDTEKVNPNTSNIDSVSTLEAIKLMNTEDKLVANAVEKELPRIANLIDAVEAQMRRSGRLIYIGAGTSGRIGILDASECPATFGVPSWQVQGIIAGGKDALVSAVEDVEDKEDLAIQDLKAIDLKDNDILVAIAASGRTPYVIRGIQYAKSVGALTGCITTSSKTMLANMVDYPVEVLVGPEVIAGSTRMKSATAQKMVCNMISTEVMIKLGKVYDNFMIDLVPENEKLKERSVRIICEITGASPKYVGILMNKYKDSKTTLLAILSNESDIEKLQYALGYCFGNVKEALQLLKQKK